MEQPLTPHQVIAARVRELRKKRGWSAAHLAAEMTKVGVPWERMVVTKLENGRRQNVTVEELFALANVLSVAPVHLVVPPLSSDESERVLYRVTPAGQQTWVAYARAWVRGRAPLGDPRVYFAEVPEDEWSPPDWQWTPAMIEAAGKLRDGWNPRGTDADDAGR
jgi:transcriptional regulator with XRE-family HTH domain